MLLEVLDSTVASIAEVRREVVVVGQVALHLLHPMILHLRMLGSLFGMFLVVCFLYCKDREGRLAHVEGVLGVRLASAVGCWL